MNASKMLSLRYKPLWIAVSGVLLVAVVWGSLQTSYGLKAPHGFDKIEHFATYMFMSVWFTGLLHRLRYWIAAVSLLFMGLAMELTQGAMATGRMADPYDMAANTCGVLVGLLLALLLTGGWAQRVEAWMR